MRFLFQMARPGNILIAVLTLGAGYFLSNGHFSPAIFAADALAFAFAIAFGNILNDLLDIRCDRVNRPDRPLPAGKVSAFAARATAILCLLLTLLFAIPGSPALRLGFFAAVLATLFLYDRFFKRIPLLKNAVVAFLCATPLFRAALLPEADPRPLLTAALFAFLFTLAREIQKDLEDEIGDLKAGVATFPLIAGESKAKTLSSALILFATFSVPVPVLLGWFSPAFLLALLPLVPLAFFICKDTFQNKFHSAETLTKTAMVAGLFALVLNGIFQKLP